MSYYSELNIDTRTCGQADEDAYLDYRDGLTISRVNWNSKYNATLADATNYRYAQAQREGAARTQYLSPSARLLRLSSRYQTARREGRTQAAAAIKRMANKIVEAM